MPISFNHSFDENLAALFLFAEESSQAVCVALEESSKAVSFAAISGGEALSNVVKGANKCFSQVEGLRAITSATSTAIRALEFSEVSTEGFEKLGQTLRSIHEIIVVRNIVLRFSEFVSGEALWKNSKDAFPNLVRLSSRVAFIISDIFNTLKFLEKMSLVALGTGNLLALKTFGDTMEPVSSVLGYVATSLELVDNISIAVDEGLNWENGFAIGTGFAKLVSIHVTGSKEHGAVVLGLISGATSSLIFFVKFIKAEYGI